MKSTFNGAKLKQERIAHGYTTQDKMSKDLWHKFDVFITAQSIKNHEDGVHEPRMSIVLDYAKFFGVDINTFYEDKKNANTISIHDKSEVKTKTIKKKKNSKAS